MKTLSEQPEYWRARMPSAWGGWLNDFVWTHYVTLTFNFEATAPQASEHFKGFIRRLEQRANRRIEWFYVVERGRFGRIHVHALLNDFGSLSTGAILDAWQCTRLRRGLAQVDKYDPKRGARYYMAKGIGGDVTDYDVSKTLHARPDAEI